MVTWVGIDSTWTKFRQNLKFSWGQGVSLSPGVTVKSEDMVSSQKGKFLVRVSKNGVRFLIRFIFYSDLTVGLDLQKRPYA